MKKLTFILLIPVFLFCTPGTFAQNRIDTIKTSLALNYSLNGGWADKESFGLSQRINPSVNLRYRKSELLLGLDYSTVNNHWSNDANLKENYLGFTPGLRRYFGEKEYFFAEAYLKTGYYWSNGNGPEFSDQYLTNFGLGVGARIHLNRLDKYRFMRNVDFTVSLRQNVFPRDNPLGNTELLVGITYKFK